MITATSLGRKKCATAAHAAICSRRSKRSSAASDSDDGSSTVISPGSVRIRTGRPLSRNVASMPRFSGITSATSNPMPCSTACSASPTSMIEPKPRP